MRMRDSLRCRRAAGVCRPSLAVFNGAAAGQPGSVSRSRRRQRYMGARQRRLRPAEPSGPTSKSGTLSDDLRHGRLLARLRAWHCPRGDQGNLQICLHHSRLQSLSPGRGDDRADRQRRAFCSPGSSSDDLAQPPRGQHLRGRGAVPRDLPRRGRRFGPGEATRVSAGYGSPEQRPRPHRRPCSRVATTSTGTSRRRSSG